MNQYMKKYLKICLALIVLLTAATYFLARQNTAISQDNALSSQPNLTPAQASLQAIGERCVSFGERAVADNTPTIEFQRLEREAKRFDVVERCMTDNGYMQNPAWLKLAQVIAKTDAETQKISADEALVNLSRKAMPQFVSANNLPDYWLKK